MEAGFTLNQYILLEPLGEGGMAEVWKGKHSRLDFEVAIKFLKPQFAHDRDLQERFLNEGKRQANLDHPNIVRALDFITDGDRNFLVMKYVEGGGLDRRIDESRGPLPEEQVLAISSQVLSALAYAHRQGVVHRDVKPSNILMDREGNCYLTDFGIALAVGQRRLTRTGTVMGTVDYMSPEQIRSPHTVDHRTDIYAFGVVLFEMLTGVVPFKYDTEFLVEQAHVQQAPPKPSKLNPLLSKAMESVVLRALAKDPDDRWSDCEAMTEALEVARSGARPPFRKTRPQGTPTPVPAGPRIPALEERRLTPPRGDRSARGRTAMVALAAGIMLAAVLGIAAKLFIGSRPHHDPTPVRTPPFTVPTKRPTPEPPVYRPNPLPSPLENPGIRSPKEPAVPIKPRPRLRENERVPEPPPPDRRTDASPKRNAQETPKEEAYKKEFTDTVSLPEPKLPPERQESFTKDNTSGKSVSNSVEPVKPPESNSVLPDATAVSTSRGGVVTPEPGNIGQSTGRLPGPSLPNIAPSLPPRREAPVPATGTLIWSVQLKKGTTQTLTQMRPSNGQVHGDPLPGVPIAISISPPNIAGVADPPNPTNGWTGLTLRGLVNGNVVVTIQWRRL